ncbi:MAG: hypothetical protein ABW068_10220 [Candidatus Thiodiazotropha sp.]
MANPPADDPLSEYRAKPQIDNTQDKQEATRMFPRPMGPQFEAEDAALNCRQLDQAIAMLENDTYTAKPGFYEDPYTGASIWIGAIWAPGALAYLGYSGVAEYYEDDRIGDSQNRIEALRRMKAQMHCYEY